MKIYRNKTLGSIFLVAGTQIGAGMLALPLTTGASGFFYSFLVLLVCFLFMLTSLFYLLEANLMTDRVNANLISMVKECLGPIGQFFAWLSFLLLLYSVAAAYLSGGGSLLGRLLTNAWNIPISPNIGIFIFLIIFGFIVVFGTRAVDTINRFCMAGLILSFLFLLIFVTPHIQTNHLKEGSPIYISAAIPVVILSFTSHIILPSLRTYLSGDVHKLKTVLFWGSLIPLIFYLVWEFLIIGILPLEGEYSLKAISSANHPIAALTIALNHIGQVKWMGLLVGFFSFFGLVTSFFGVSLSLYDFLADGLRIKKNRGGRLILLTLMFLPPLIFALFYPKSFLLAIGYAGVFVGVLYGIFPVLMVWKGRYIDKKKEHFQVIGGKALLIIILIGSISVLLFQVGLVWNWFPSVT